MAELSSFQFAILRLLRNGVSAASMLKYYLAQQRFWFIEQRFPGALRRLIKEELAEDNGADGGRRGFNLTERGRLVVQDDSLKSPK